MFYDTVDDPWLMMHCLQLSLSDILGGSFMETIIFFTVGIKDFAPTPLNGISFLYNAQEV